MKTFKDLIKKLELELILLEDDKSNKKESKIKKLKSELRKIKFPTEKNLERAGGLVLFFTNHNENIYKEFKEQYKAIEKNRKKDEEKAENIIEIINILKIPSTTFRDWKNENDYKNTLYLFVTSFSKDEIIERLNIKIEFNISDNRRINEYIKIPIRTLSKWRKKDSKRFLLYSFINSFSEEELKKINERE